MSHLVKIVVHFFIIFSSLNSLAQNQCASNTNGRTSTCAGSRNTCYSYPGHSMAPFSTAFSSVTNQECCYDPQIQSCGAGAALGVGNYVPIVCPDQSPYSTSSASWTPCGMTCVPTIPGCNEDYCKDIGYSYMCPISKSCTNDLSFCPESSSNSSCESQGKTKCGSSCIDPNRNTCIQNKVCGKDDDGLCNNECIDYAKEKCINNTKVCPIEADALCNNHCIDSDTQACIKNTYPCEKKFNDICGSVVHYTCFDNTLQNCVEGSRLCDKPLDAWDTCTKCYKKNSLSIGESCFKNVQCSVGKCNGFTDPVCKKGTCVCKDDADCASNEYCDKGVILGIGKNSCKLKKASAVGCGKDSQCLSGRCNLGKCKE